MLKRILLFMLFIILVLPSNSFANNGPAYNTKLIVSANLEDKNNLGYFDLILKPNEKKTISINIENTDTKEVSVKIKAVTSSTGENGEIDYSNSRLNMMENLEVSFDKIAKIEKEVYTIKPKEKIVIPIEISMPDTEYQGILLGSIHVLQIMTKEETENVKGNIKNEYAFAIAVKIQSKKDIKIEPNFYVKDVKAELQNSVGSISIYIVNPQPMIYKDVKVSCKIYSSNSKETPLFDISNDVDFAPNSIYLLLAKDKEGYGIKAGKYNAILNINGVESEKEFEVSSEQENVIKEKSVSIQNKIETNNKSNLIIIIILLLLILIILLLLIKRKKEDKKNEDKNKKDDENKKDEIN